MAKLREGVNFKRSLPSKYKCPQCGNSTLRDEGSPNYGGGVVIGRRSENSGTIKHVCEPCKIAFLVHWWRIADYATDFHEEGESISNISPLVERDGYLLTPLDVQDYEYFDKHGVWETRIYY